MNLGRGRAGLRSGVGAGRPSAAPGPSVKSDVGCHMAMLIVSPSIPAGRRSGELFNHYSLLRTTEDLVGVPPLGEAAKASSMTHAFGLGSQ
jgi:hypothetical protein